METKKCRALNFSVKKIGEDGYFGGYASVFNVTDQQNDIIKEKAFNVKSIDNIPILWQHKPEFPIGKVLSIKKDEIGLYIEAKLIIEVKKAYEAYKLLANGIISGLSIGYIAKKFDIANNDSKTRIITSIDLIEISLVTFPANKNAVVNLVKKNVCFMWNNELEKIYSLLR